ncbi:MAG: response regulator [Bacillota bacterium]|nr:response regulator [Bacillota bacterium]
MSEQRIKILIVDDVAETRENLRKLLSFGQGFIVAGEAENGKEAIALAKRVRPDVVLMDINMPVMGGIEATEAISVEVPTTTVIIISVQGESEYLREAMAAGARDYLIKPFSADDLVNTIRRAHEMDAKRRLRFAPVPIAQRRTGRIVTVFSTKGGVGKTTIATNLATELASHARKSVVLMDLDLQFGDVAIMLDSIPIRTIADIAKEDEIDSELVEACLLTHKSGVRVLASPLRPEQAEIVTAKHVEAILTLLAETHDFIVVDMPQGLNDITLTALDAADKILLVTTLELPAIKNARLCLEIMEALGYDQDKVKLVLNRSSRDIGLSIEEMEKILRRSVDVHIPSDGRVVVPSVNKGVPFVASAPSARISQTIRDLARVIGDGDADTVAAAAAVATEGAAAAAAATAGVAGAPVAAGDGRGRGARRRAGISGRIFSIFTGG